MESVSTPANGPNFGLVEYVRRVRSTLSASHKPRDRIHFWIGVHAFGQSIFGFSLVHIVKQAEVATGAGTATVTRVLAERINEGAALGDVVGENALRQRVQYQSGEKVSAQNEQIKNNPPPPKDETSIKEDSKQEPKAELPKEGTMACLSYPSQQYASMAISQIDRNPKQKKPRQPKWLPRLYTGSNYGLSGYIYCCIEAPATGRSSAACLMQLSSRSIMA